MVSIDFKVIYLWYIGNDYINVIGEIKDLFWVIIVGLFFSI